MNNNINSHFQRFGYMKTKNFVLEMQCFKKDIQKNKIFDSCQLWITQDQTESFSETYDKKYLECFSRMINQMSLGMLVQLLEKFNSTGLYSFEDFSFQLLRSNSRVELVDEGYLSGQGKLVFTISLTEFTAVLYFYLFCISFLLELQIKLDANFDYKKHKKYCDALLPTFNSFCSSYGVNVQETFLPDPEFYEAFPEIKDMLTK